MTYVVHCQPSCRDAAQWRWGQGNGLAMRWDPMAYESMADTQEADAAAMNRGAASTTPEQLEQRPHAYPLLQSCHCERSAAISFGVINAAVGTRLPRRYARRNDKVGTHEEQRPVEASLAGRVAVRRP